MFQVILLIYEYAIAVEWSLVQRIRSENGTYHLIKTSNDTPFADRLDRSFFGFDQDYYERMPLLVNALQESNYVDPGIDMSRTLSQRPYGKNGTIPRKFAPDAYRQTKIRKTSPRPFIFEYRSATPLPFSKTYGSRSWVDSYRNAQRLQNIRQVIRYLEKTINAKAGDMHTKPTNGHTSTSIAFSGVYVEPKNEKEKPEESNGSMELQQQNSYRVETYANHNEDPLFNFKPDSPGEVNLLADTFFRFAPVPMSSIIEDPKPKKIPMFRRIPYRKYCRGSHCENIVQDKLQNLKSSTEHITELPTSTKSFSVMLNLFPLKPNASPEFMRQDERAKPSDKIYITTPKPLIQFRKKPTPMRRTYYRHKKPKYLTRSKNISDLKSTEQKVKTDNNNTTILVHVDVHSPDDKNGLRNQTLIQYTTTTIRPSTFIPITEKPIELFAGQVEDHHDGSSGLISIQIPENIETSTSPSVPTVIPFFDSTTANTEANPWATSPPDVMKFSAEDAKVPDHYMNMATTTELTNLDKYNMNWVTTQAAPMETEIRSMDLPTTDMERKYRNWETTQTMPTEMDRIINWETTQPPISMDRRSMNLLTTKAVPMQTVHINMDWITTQAPMEMDTRETNSETTTTMDRGNMKWASTKAPKEMDRYGKNIEKPVVNKLRDTLIIKLRNGIITTEKANPTTTEEIEETTTMKTYVPQINGHYRSIVEVRNQNRYSPETYRKRKLEMSVTGFRSYVPMYTEIKRNKTKTVDGSE